MLAGCQGRPYPDSLSLLIWPLSPRQCAFDWAPRWLQIQGISGSESLHVLMAVSRLPRLQRLALSDFSSSRLLFPAQTPNRLESLFQLSHCAKLTELELLHMSIRPDQVR